jgi:hypothetical protein
MFPKNLAEKLVKFTTQWEKKKIPKIPKISQFLGFKNTLQVRNSNLTCVGYWNTFVL